MRTVETVKNLRKLGMEWTGQIIGFVPTMGALHEGHLALVRHARAENTRVLVSIFVNPTQFNDPKDLERYPRPIKKDLELLKAAGADAVFLPQAAEIYMDGYNLSVVENKLSQILCGPTRPGHFTGMLTIVLKLLNLADAHRSYFGEKDYQQLMLIKEMAKAFFLKTEIVGRPTVRESDGLAMSSRNTLLSVEERKIAPQIFRVLSMAKSAQDARKELESLGFKVDYVEEHWGRRFAAAFLGEVRLIDNVAL